MLITDEQRAGEMDKMYELGKKRKDVELSALVKELEEKYERLDSLCGEILATILVNTKRGDLPSKFIEWGMNWEYQLKSIRAVNASQASA